MDRLQLLRTPTGLATIAHSTQKRKDCKVAYAATQRYSGRMEVVTEGHRERKKRKTREAIVEAAMALFDAKGFDATTIAEIADAAEIAPRTFFAYFPSKEDVVFSDFDVALDAMRQRFTERPADEGAIDALRNWIAEMVGELDPADERQRFRRALIQNNDSLHDHDRAQRGRFQEALAAALRDDFGGPDSDLRAQMVAAAAISALATMTDDPVATEARFGDDPMTVVDEALAFVRGGIAALESR